MPPVIHSMEKTMSKIAERVARANAFNDDDATEQAPVTMNITAEQIAAIANQAVAAYIASSGGLRKGQPGYIDPKLDEEAARLAAAAPNVDLNDRVWIILSENKHITKGGQFFGINGMSFLLKPGKKAFVPRALCNVLDDAIEGVAITDEDGTIVEYRQAMRYPYQVTTPP